MALLSSLPEEWGGPALAQVNKTHITNNQAHARGSRFSFEQFSHVLNSCQSKPRESLPVPGSASRVLCSRSVGFTSPCCLLGFCSSDLLPSGVCHQLTHHLRDALTHSSCSHLWACSSWPLSQSCYSLWHADACGLLQPTWLSLGVATTISFVK